jgi:aryl-alcohol dehydrogenase-like predicted oxidoreductase
MAIEYRRLGRSGLKVTNLALGAMTFGESATFMKGVTSSDQEARAVLERALEVGIDFIDTANVYSEGRSEELLGEWLGPRREKIVLATKCRFPVGSDPKLKPNESGLSRRHLLQACEASLRRLRTDWIDLYQVHMQDRSVPIDETLRALDDLIRQGKVRYAGCSNYTGYRLTESLWASDRHGVHRYESVQLQWSLIERGAEREMIPACREFGLGVLVWSPLARGLLTGKYQRSRPPPPGTRLEAWQDTWKRQSGDERTWRVLDEVQAVAREAESTPARVAIAWLLEQPECTSVILGARTVAQLEDNLAAASLRLAPEQVRRLEQASRPQWAYPYEFIAVREPW